MTASTASAAVRLDGIRRSFGATVAVNDVSFAIETGTVHALLGENGAGKSTIVKLLSGLIEPDTGRFTILGQTTRLTNPRRAHRIGIQTAYQEMTLVKDLTVLDNMLIPYAPTGITGMIRRRAAEAAVESHFADIGLRGINPREEVRDLDLAVQQKIEIARAIFRRPKILLLDEPTSTLSGKDVDWLGEVIARLKAQGVTVVFISHRIPEVRAFCDHLTVLRNGTHIATGRVADHSDTEVIEMIIGRSMDQTFPPRPDTPSTPATAVLSVSDLAAGRKLTQADFTLHKGEILGVAGLDGMGQLDLFLACFGMTELHRGTISVDGESVVFTTPEDAIRADIGIGMVPEDRKTEALFLKLSGGHNASLPVIDRFTRFGLINGARERQAIRRVFDRVQVDQRAQWTPVRSFSGGNQQKIAIAKWLLAESRILLLYDPTRGIDVGTKHELYLLMREYAAAGGAILFFSTEIPELVHMADRTLVFYGGRLAEEIQGEQQTEQAIVHAALGGGSIIEDQVA